VVFGPRARRLASPPGLPATRAGTISYLSVLEQAVRRRGIPKRLYVDNGAAFRSKQLAIVCAKIGIALIHAKPYTPQGKGKMERWFRTTRMQLLPLLSAEQLVSLETMNRALAAWIEGEYHHAPHRGLGEETPADKWARASERGSAHARRRSL
jgi:transposase InsO family protein